MRYRVGSSNCLSFYSVAELFMPADTPTGAMTYVMVNKRKNTLLNRHKRQLQRLCDFQSKELHDHRQAFCTRYKDQKRVSGTLSSEIGMFQVISGSKWLRENYESIFKPASAEVQSEDVEIEKSLDSESRVFDELMVAYSADLLYFMLSTSTKMLYSCRIDWIRNKMLCVSGRLLNMKHTDCFS